MKPHVRRLAAGLALSAGLFHFAAAAESAVPFRSTTFEAAQQAAANEGKLIFIDFYTTWCEPCKRLDALTWTDATVGKIVGEKAVALKIDAEKEGRDLAKRYNVSAYPTLLLLKADGTEVDRIVGFREPAPFKAEFDKVVMLAQVGKSGLEQARQEAANADPDEAAPRFELAQKLSRSGDSAAALAELLWCWDEGKKDPDFAPMRASRVASALMALARTYPPAKEAIIVRRDQAREKVLAGKGGTAMTQDLIALNAQLKEEEDSLAVFDKLPEGDRRRVTLSIYLFNLLVEKQRYADALLYYQPGTAIMSLERAKRPPPMPSGAKLSDEVAGSMMRFAVERAAKQVEALAGASRLEEARVLIGKVLAVDDSENTRAALLSHLTRASHPELADLRAAKD